MMNEDHLLVSVVVPTYNSSRFVLETLESVKGQTYRNIELIVTDDGSSDDTIRICRDWIGRNEQRFVRCRLITAKKNTGIPANCNRGCSVAGGEWIKIIAGDDALLPNCIRDYVNFIEGRPEIEICHSKAEVYDKLLDEEHFLWESFFPQKMISLSAEKQHKWLYRKILIPSCSVFMKTDLLKRMDYFNEDFCLCEDWPLWLKITYSGSRFYFMDKTTVKYRIYQESVSRSKIKNYLSEQTYRMFKYADENYIKQQQWFLIKLELRYKMFLYKFLEKYHLNTPALSHTIIFNLLYFPVSVRFYWDSIYIMGLKYYLSRLKNIFLQ